MPAVRLPPKLEKPKILIAVGGKAAFDYLPLTVADQLGYFRAEGLEVEIRDFVSDALALHAVSSGEAHVVSGAYEHTIRLQSKGQKFQAFVLQGRAPAVAMGISPKNMPHYQSGADLKDKKIGISALGSSAHTMTHLILARAGLKADDVSLVAVGTVGRALGALRSGQIDALCNVEPVITMLEQKGELRIIADTRTLKGTLDVFGGPMPAGCLYAPFEFIQNHADVIQAITHAMARSLKWLQTAGPSDIIKAVPESYLRGDRALYLAAFNKVRESISPDGLMPDGSPLNAARVLARFDPAINAEKIELAATYTNEFASIAKERFKS